MFRFGNLNFQFEVQIPINIFLIFPPYAPYINVQLQSNSVRTLKGLISFAIVRSSLAVIGKYSSIAYFSSCSVSKSNCSSLDGAMSVKSAKMFHHHQIGGRRSSLPLLPKIGIKNKGS